MSPDEPFRELSIGELAEITGRSVDSLRYYEREGLIPRVRRNPSGHRRYTEQHIYWVALLGRLRASGMSVARVRDYCRLAERGDETRSAREELLRRHEADVVAHIEDLQRSLRIVRAKIGFYESGEKDPSGVWKVIAQEMEGGRDGAPDPA